MCLGLLSALALDAAPARRPNVLFIAADDLRVELGCYGSPFAQTPNLDALARRGVQFERAYCQQAVCNPSRASVMTGRRPDNLRVWDLQTHFRETWPEIVTLPQWFKQHGYTAIDIGKIDHNENGPRAPKFPFADPLSWSAPPRFAVGAHWQDCVVPGSSDGPKVKAGPAQCVEAPDNAYFDGKIADEAVAALQKFKQSGEPFFLAVGFWKPHLPFNAPKKYWDLYDRAKLIPQEPAQMPAGAPAIAHHHSTELRNYNDVPRDGPLSAEQTVELRHGYFACISFLDAQVGKVLAELDRTGLGANTIIVFWADHGFHIGEHDLWGKTSNYELDAHVPLMIAAPGVSTAGGKSGALVELVDLYPTLVELAGLRAMPGLQGDSLVPQLRKPETRGRSYAMTQHPHPFYGKATHMGYAVRTEQYRYVEWRDLKDGAVAWRELYDHQTDPRETTNCVEQPKHRAAVVDLGQQAARYVAEGRRWPELNLK